jgi:hypothetical protein
MRNDPRNANTSFLQRFRQELTTQRWDDHRYYHQSRINQSLHWVSSISFLTMYGLLLVSPSAAALLGWLFAMSTRQIGHFFFEPRDYDNVNKATQDYKESIKVGYNLQRKRILYALWALIPITLYFDPTLLGVFSAYTNLDGYLYNLSMSWLVLGLSALLFRTIHLFFIRDVMTGVVWFTKILTDPFHDFKIYMKAPVYLMRGQLIDPMHHTFSGIDKDEEESLLG